MILDLVYLSCASVAISFTAAFVVRIYEGVSKPHETKGWLVLRNMGTIHNCYTKMVIASIIIGFWFYRIRGDQQHFVRRDELKVNLF